MNNLSKNIKFLRKQQGLSQEEFALKVGLNRGNIASYEKGNAEPKMESLLTIAKYFNTSVLRLVEEPMFELHGTNTLVENSDVILSEILNNVENDEQMLSQLHNFENSVTEISDIVNGFNNYHKFKMRNFEHVSPELNKMAVDFEELFDITAKLIDQHKHLIYNMTTYINKQD